MFKTFLRLMPLFFLSAGLAFADPTPPNLSGVISVAGRFSVAHACPISPEVAITNAHVMDIQPFNKEVPLLSYRWEGGYLRPVSASWSEDLSLFFREGDPFPVVYPISSKAPEAGEQLWWVGYDWSKPSRALRIRTYTGHVVEVRAGVFSLDTETPSGSSGGCVLNARGEVVGLIAWGREMDNKSNAAFAVSVWGRWFNLERAIESAEAWKKENGR